MSAYLTVEELDGLMEINLRNDWVFAHLNELQETLDDIDPVANRRVRFQCGGLKDFDLAGAWIPEFLLQRDPDQPRAGLHYEYYEITGLAALPDFDALTPASTGKVSTADLSVREHDDHFALRFRGYLSVEVAGDYTFYTNSDDGSQLFIDGILVVDNVATGPSIGGLRMADSAALPVAAIFPGRSVRQRVSGSRNWS